jgi:hypothetical protein
MIRTLRVPPASGKVISLGGSISAEARCGPKKRVMIAPGIEEEVACSDCGRGFCTEPCFNRGDKSLVQQNHSGNGTGSFNSARAWGPAMDKPASPFEQQNVQEPSAVKERETAKSPEARVPESVAPVRSISPTPGKAVGDGATAAVAPDQTQPDQPHRAARGRGEPPKTVAAPVARTPDIASKAASPGQPSVATSSGQPSVAPSLANASSQRRAASVRESASGPVPSRVEESAVPLPSVTDAAGPRTPPPASSRQATKNELADSPRPEPVYPAYANSRLAGIRKLLVSLGRRSLTQAADIAGKDTDLEPRFERATVRPTSAEPGPSKTEASDGGSPSPARVTVRPEFLRPRAAAEVEREKEPLRPTSPQPLRDKADSQEEIETLPSVRGQYRRKKYPPI